MLTKAIAMSASLPVPPAVELKMSAHHVQDHYFCREQLVSLSVVMAIMLIIVLKSANHAKILVLLAQVLATVPVVTSIVNSSTCMMAHVSRHAQQKPQKL